MCFYALRAAGLRWGCAHSLQFCTAFFLFLCLWLLFPPRDCDGLHRATLNFLSLCVCLTGVTVTRAFIDLTGRGGSLVLTAAPTAALSAASCACRAASSAAGPGPSAASATAASGAGRTPPQRMQPRGAAATSDTGTGITGICIASTSLGVVSFCCRKSLLAMRYALSPFSRALARDACIWLHAATSLPGTVCGCLPWTA